MGAYSKVGAYLSEIPQGVGAYSKGGLLEGGGLIEYLRYLPQKGAKVGGAVGKNQPLCILLKIGSLHLFDILHEVKGH